MRNSENLEIKKCTIASLNELQKISVQTFSDSFRHQNNPADFDDYLNFAFSKKQIQIQLANPASQFYFCYLNEALCGYLKINFSDAQTDIYDPESLEVQRIYVDKNLKGKGLGKALMNHAFQIGEMHRLKYIWLGVWDKNPEAIAFYKKLGFDQFDKHSFKIGEDLQTDILMKLSLSYP